MSEKRLTAAQFARGTARASYARDMARRHPCEAGCHGKPQSAAAAANCLAPGERPATATAADGTVRAVPHHYRTDALGATVKRARSMAGREVYASARVAEAFRYAVDDKE